MEIHLDFSILNIDTPHFAAVITFIDLNANECRCKYFEYPEAPDVTLPLTTIRRISVGVLNKSDIYVGYKGQCKYSQDQLYYDCEVQGITDHGCAVIYTQYGNTEEVPIQYIRPFIQKQAKKENKDNSLSLIKIPENLKILPTDTEEEKLRKKKKIKAIKNKNRVVVQELEVANVQNNWKKFVTKVSIYILIYIH